MAEQFLDRPQVAAATQQMGREGMAQRMRRRRLRQAEGAAKRPHVALKNAGLQRTARASPGEEGAVVERFQFRDIGKAGWPAEMAGQELQELAGVALIGFQRLRREAAFAFQLFEPAAPGSGEIGLRIDEKGAVFGHAAILPGNGYRVISRMLGETSKSL